MTNKSPLDHKTPLGAWRSYRETVPPRLLVAVEPSLRLAFLAGAGWATGQVATRAEEIRGKVLDAVGGEAEGINPCGTSVAQELQRPHPGPRCREYKTAKHLVDALATFCAADPDKVVELLTGYLWSEQEAAAIQAALDPRAAANKHEVHDAG